MNNSNETNPESSSWPLRTDGKIALVTGAAGGLGQSFTRCLLNTGATVIVSGRRREALESLKSQHPGHSDRIHVVPMDVSDEASVTQAFDVMAGGVGIPDVVVANAGVAVSKKALSCTGDDWDAVIDTNLKGCWFVATEAARPGVGALWYSGQRVSAWLYRNRSESGFLRHRTGPEYDSSHSAAAPRATRRSVRPVAASGIGAF